MEPLLSAGELEQQRHSSTASSILMAERGSSIQATLRCLLVGDSGVGKTSLLRVIAGCPQHAGAAWLDSAGEQQRRHNQLAQPVTLSVDLPDADGYCSRQVRLHLEDTPGADAMDVLRPRLYPGADAFALCCSLGDRASVNRVVTKWLPEVSRHRPGAPCVLVVTQSDRVPGLDECGKHKKLAVSIRRAAKATNAAVVSEVAAPAEYLACSARHWRHGGAAETRLVDGLARLALLPPSAAAAATAAPATGRDRNAGGMLKCAACLA